MPRLYGLTLSNDATTPNTVIDIAPGGGFDTTATWYMRLGAAVTKSLVGTWTAGSGNGGLDTGSVQANTGYHVRLIYDPSSKAVDVLLSLSFTSPGLPSRFAGFLPVGAVVTDANGHIRPFVQKADEFLYVSGVQDKGGSGVPSSPALVGLSVPQGLKVSALIRPQAYNATTGNTLAMLFYSPDEGAQTPTISPGSGAQNACLVVDAAESGNNGYASVEMSVRTNTSGQIGVSANGAGPNFLYGIWTRGFVYPRGLQ